MVEDAGEGRLGQILAVVGVRNEVAPSRADALAAAGGLVCHARDDLDEEVVRLLSVPLLFLVPRAITSQPGDRQRRKIRGSIHGDGQREGTEELPRVKRQLASEGLGRRRKRWKRKHEAVRIYIYGLYLGHTV